MDVDLDAWQDKCAAAIHSACCGDARVVFLVKCPRRYGKTTLAAKLFAKHAPGSARILTTSARNIEMLPAGAAMLVEEYSPAHQQLDMIILDNWDHLDLTKEELNALHSRVRCVVLIGSTHVPYDSDEKALKYHMDIAVTNVFDVADYVRLAK